jgi:diguanylate cyclase (GGDEF)-like protein
MSPDQEIEPLRCCPVYAERDRITTRLSWVAAQHQPLSLVLIDIDFFKQMNDSLGHSAADDGLKALASCLVQVAKRSPDRAARFGGDEFILVLPDTDADGAMKIPNRIQDMVQELNIEIRTLSDSKFLSVSQGVAAAVPDRRGTWKGLLLDADRALYRAKQSGRGRVALWTSSHA